MTANGSPPAPDRTPTRHRLAATAVVVLGFAAIVALARRPPILDLPQLVDQVARFAEVVAGERPDLAVDWVGPNKAGPLLVGLGRALGGPAWGPRLAVILTGALWLLSMHFVAARAGRPASAAVLVSPLLLGSAFYAGFFNFVAGAAGLAFWTWELEASRRDRGFWPIVLSTACGTLLLYFCHVLWLIVGGFAVATCVLLVRFRAAETLARAVGVLPVLPLLVLWSRGQQGSGWQTMVLTMVEPIDRVSSIDMASSLALGGLRHPVEPVVLLTLLAWAVLGGARAVGERGRGLHPFLLVAALVFGAIALLAPDTIDKTMLFAWRWGGFALATAVLAVPPPRAGGRWLIALAACVAAAHALVTATVWSRYDRVEMAGFEAALSRVPEGARLLALDAGDPFAPLTLDPFVHQHVYATTERRATVAFTFADLGNSLIRRSRLADRRNSADFVLWQPGMLRPSDVRRYSHLFVRCPPDRLERLARFAGLIRIVEGGGQWGLFEVAKVAADVALPPDQPASDATGSPAGGDGSGPGPPTQRPASHQAPAASTSPG